MGSAAILKKNRPKRYVRQSYWSDDQGRLHRLDGPAIVEFGYIEKWYVHGVLHREGGPAEVNRRDGQEKWYRNGVLHREDGPAFISTEVKAWYKDGNRHRIGGPAIEGVDGSFQWYENGQLHRLDGPARYANGGYSWYVRGEYFTEDEFYRFVDTLSGEVFWPVGRKPVVSVISSLFDLITSVFPMGMSHLTHDNAGRIPRKGEYLRMDEVDMYELDRKRGNIFYLDHTRSGRMSSRR